MFEKRGGKCLPKTMWFVALSALLIFSSLQTAWTQIQSADGWLYVVNANNQITIIGASGKSGAVTIPGMINGKSVFRVGNGSRVFGPISNNVTSITIPGSVTSLENNAFSGCVNLSSIIIPGSVTNIGSYAFHGCTTLGNINVSETNPAFSSIEGVLYNKEITSLLRYPQGKSGSFVIPENVISVGNSAFQGCIHLTGITIPSTLTTIGTGVFVGSSSLVNILVEPANPLFSSADGVLYNKGQTILIAYPSGKSGIYSILESVTTIAESAFSSAVLTSVIIPDGVTSVGAGAFQYCTRLSSVTLPNSVTSIGASVFQGCASLSSVTIPDSVTIIEDSTFYDCASLSTVTIPNSITSIGASAFQGCASLSAVAIPNSVALIGENAFRDCTSLAGVTIPNSLTSLSYGVFAGSGLTSVTIPNSVTSIGGSAFEGCASLTTVTIQNSGTSIGGCAFDSTNLNFVFVPDGFQINQEGRSVFPYLATIISPSLINALATNDAFVTAVANKIKSTGGNYGIATQSGVSNIVTATTSNLVTKAELTASLSQSRTDGINSVLSNPNLWTLYTTNQIKNMVIGDLVLSKQVNGLFVLNYDIEQSEDMQTWTPYLSYALPMTNLPIDKAFVRIKAK